MTKQAKHYLDGDFVSGVRRSEFLEATISVLKKDEAKRRYKNLVMLEFKNDFTFRFPLLPSEARQLAESLKQIADEADPSHEE